MQQNFIDSTTLQPKRFGELYTDRNIRLAGEARYNSGTSQVETRGLRILCTPTGGGAEAITIVPDGLYSLPATDTSIWLQVRRTAGSTTVLFGTSLLAVGAGVQTPPLENWVQLFYRSSVVGEIIAYGSFLVGLTPNWTRIGITRATGIYDAIVGQNPADPHVTHTNIQTAINDCVDGNRILILEGLYNITTATGYSATSALSWLGKTLTLEGEGYNTIIKNGGGFLRAFSIQSSNSSFTASQGSGSRIQGIQIQSFNQTVQFDGGVGLGIRNIDVDVWQTDFITASYVAPAVVGTGTSEQNSVREKAISTTGTAQDQLTIASGVAASNITRIEAAGKLSFNELVDFNRPTLGYGILPLGSVIATFPTLTGAYVCSATTAADARGFVQCNGQTIVDATSPMNGVVIPNINNNVFLSGNVTSGLTGGANSLNTSVPASGLTTSGTNTAASITWNSANVVVSGGTGSFLKSVFNTDQIGHTHALNSPTSAAKLSMISGFTTVAVKMKTLASSWTPSLFNAWPGATNPTAGPQAESLELVGSTVSGNATWSGVAVNFSLSGAAFNKNSLNTDQNAHTHTWSGSVAGTATAAVWDNRPLYISARYLMRIK